MKFNRDSLINDIYNGKIFKDSVNHLTHFAKHDSSVIADIDNVISNERIKPSSHFEIDTDDAFDSDKISEIMKIMIGDAFVSNIEFEKRPSNNALYKLSNAQDQENIDFSMDYGRLVGKGIVYSQKNDTLNEYVTNQIRIVLKRDFKNKNGFIFVTAYPDLKNIRTLVKNGVAKPTNRDLKDFVKQTSTYQQASREEQLYFSAIASKSCQHIQVPSHPHDTIVFSILATSTELLIVSKEARSIGIKKTWQSYDLLKNSIFESTKRSFAVFRNDNTINTLRNNILENKKGFQKQASESEDSPGIIARKKNHQLKL